MKFYRNRFKPTLPYIKGKILEIGCVGMGENDILGGKDFLFGYLNKISSYVTGIDINKKGIKNLYIKGCDVLCRDAQEVYNLNERFDTIISEENIEHISNLKTYLQNVKNHLKKNGTFILTTPNMASADFMLHNLIRGTPFVNHHHTHYHSVETIQYLLKTHGFRIIKVDVFTACRFFGQNIFGKLRYIFMHFPPSKLGRTIMVVCKHD